MLATSSADEINVRLWLLLSGTLIGSQGVIYTIEDFEQLPFLTNQALKFIFEDHFWVKKMNPSADHPETKTPYLYGNSARRG